MKRFLLLFFAISFSGCFTLSSQVVPVSFEDPYARLGVQELEPTSQEQAGIVLRVKYPIGDQRSYEEESVMFNGITGEEGKKTVMNKVHTDTYSVGSEKMTAVVTSEMTIKGSKDRFRTVMEMDPRGSIVALKEGTHKTSFGKFTITAWDRTPLFADDAVRIGDNWTYSESMMLEITSWMIKDLDPKPVTIKARSTLTGFARVKGRRCAVIETVALQAQPFNFKVFFFKINLKTKTRIDETLFFDYEKGEPVARIITTIGRSTYSDGRLIDIIKVQSVESLKEEY